MVVHRYEWSTIKFIYKMTISEHKVLENFIFTFFFFNKQKGFYVLYSVPEVFGTTLIITKRILRSEAQRLQYIYMIDRKYSMVDSLSPKL